MLCWVVPEVEAETETETRADLWEAILSSMTGRSGGGWNKEGKEASLGVLSST